MNRSIPALLAACSAASTASADLSVTYSLSFTEVLAGTSTPVTAPNGVIEPGEAARVALTVTIAPGIGSVLTYTPPPLPGSGTLAGLASVYFDLNQTNALGGTWTLLTRASGWALGSRGTGNADGSLSAGQAGQFVLPPATANAANPIVDIWSGTWSPSTYSSRTAVFTCVPSLGADGGDCAVLINYGDDPLGHPQYVGWFLSGTPGSVHIPIVPAPSSMLPLLLCLSPRRRRPHP